MEFVIFCLVVLVIAIAITPRLRKRSLRRVAKDMLEPLKEVPAQTDLLESEVGIVAKKSPQDKTEKIFLPLAGAVLFALIRWIGAATPGELLFSAAIGAGAGAMVARVRAEKRTNSLGRKLERALPFALERVVMGVTAGLDIVPALKTFDGKAEEADPAERLFSEVVMLCENGLTFVAAMDQVSSKVDCPAVKHSFAHLVLAQKKGGELVRPLRELSDAISLFVQERYEEEIARLPVKATLPLLVTFAGLVVCLITIPLVQVVSVTSKVVGTAEK